MATDAACPLEIVFSFEALAPCVSQVLSDDALVRRVVARFLEAKKKRIKVKNKDTGKTQWKTPEALRDSRDPGKYEKMPSDYERNPHGRPHRPADPGTDTLPAPPKIPKPKKPPKPKKLPKLPKPVPPIKIPEPARPPQRQPPPGQKWKRESHSTS